MFALYFKHRQYWCFFIQHQSYYVTLIKFNTFKNSITQYYLIGRKI